MQVDDDFSAQSRLSYSPSCRPLLDIDEAATYLGGVSVNWMRQRVRDGEIPYRRLGRLLRFRVEELDEWLDRGRPNARR